MRIADHGSLGDRVMQHQRALHLGGADAVAGNVDHVVHATGDPVVAILVAARAVAGEVVAGIGFEVGVDHPLVIAIDAADLAGPAGLDGEHTGAGAVDFLALLIQQYRLHAEEGASGRAWLEIGGAGQRGDQDAAGFGLPPGVDDGTALLADHVEVPLPGFRVDRLAHRTQQAQAAAVGFLHGGLALAHQCADRSRCGVEDVHLVLVDHLPEARGVGVVRHAFEHQGGGAVGQRAIDDVAVAGDPADVRGAPVDVAVVVVEHVLVGHRRAQQVAAGGVQHALGFAGGAGGVEDEQRVLGVHRLRSTVLADFAQRFVVPEVTPFDPRDLALGTLDHHHGGDVRAVGQGLFHVLLQRDVLAAAHAFVGGDHRTAIGVVDTVAQGIRGEATEYHRVDRADSRAGQHGVGRFGDHRHVDADPVALLHAAALQHIGQAADVAVQLAVGDVGGLGRVVAFPDDRDLLAALFQVAVDAVVGDVELAALEPGRLALRQVAVVHRVPGLEPVEEGLGLLAPEGFRVVYRLLVEALVGIVVEVGTLAYGLRHGVKADLVHGESLLLLSRDALKGASKAWRVQGLSMLFRRARWPDCSGEAYSSWAATSCRVASP